MAGKKIGFSVAGVEEILLSAILEKYSVDLEDVELVNVNFSLSPSLMSGQVDAVIGAFRNFELNQMKIANVPGKCFFLEEEGVPPYDELIYVANANNIDKEKIRKFLKATELATQYIINNPEESWKIFASTSKELNDRLNRMAWADTLPRFALRPSAFDAGRYLEFQDFLLNNKLINKAFPISSIAIDVTRK